MISTSDIQSPSSTFLAPTSGGQIAPLTTTVAPAPTAPAPTPTAYRTSGLASPYEYGRALSKPVAPGWLYDTNHWVAPNGRAVYWTLNNGVWARYLGDYNAGWPTKAPWETQGWATTVTGTPNYSIVVNGQPGINAAGAVVDGVGAAPSGGSSAPAGGVTTLPGVTPVVDYADARSAARAHVLAEVQRELATLLAALDASSRTYQLAHDELEAAIAGTVNAELARIDAATGGTIAGVEASAIQNVDAAAVAAYRQWYARTQGAATSAVTQAVQTQQTATGGGGGMVDTGGAVGSAIDASQVGISMTQLPGTGSAASWYQSIRAKFLAAPDELRDDQAQAQYLRAHADPNHPAMAGLSSLESSVTQLLADWSKAAVSAAQVDADLSGGGELSSAVVARITSLAAVLVSFFARKATVEASLDAIAEQVLDPAQLAEYRTIAAPRGGGGLSPVVLGAVALGALFLFRRRR